MECAAPRGPFVARRGALAFTQDWMTMAFSRFVLTLSFLALPASAFAQGMGGTDTTNVDPLMGNSRKLGPLAVQARRAQDSFEQTRRLGLRFYNGGATASCEVEIEGLCYWNNNGDVPPPDERSDVRYDRELLIDLLTRAQRAEPDDDWIVGMLVRYELEAKTLPRAVASARACRSTNWWCNALLGLTLHESNDHRAAADAFAKALAQMPEEQRCQWTDLSPWLDPESQPAYRARACNERAESNARILRLGQPLWMLPSNDLSNEWYSRWTISRVHSLGRLPYSNVTPHVITAMQVRYGWPVAWSIQNGGVMDKRLPDVIGHEPTPSFNFMPSPLLLANPFAPVNDPWSFNRKDARMRYSPRYLDSLGALPFQFARFRRGDSTIVVGAYRLTRDLEMGRGPYTAGLVFDSVTAGSIPTVARRDSARTSGAVVGMLGIAPRMASLEVLAAGSKRAARVRLPITPLPTDARLSDFLLLQPASTKNVVSFAELPTTAYGSLDIVSGGTIGIYWEMYRTITPQSPVQVRIQATRVGTTFLQRLGSTIGVSKNTVPVSISYSDQGTASNSRSLGLTFPDGVVGDFNLTLVVSGGETTDSTSQVLRILPKR